MQFDIRFQKDKTKQKPVWHGNIFIKGTSLFSLMCFVKPEEEMKIKVLSNLLILYRFFKLSFSSLSRLADWKYMIM